VGPGQLASAGPGPSATPACGSGVTCVEGPERATPPRHTSAADVPGELRLVVAGEERIVHSDARTVAELLAEVGVVVGPADLVEPALDADVRQYTRVRVTRLTERVETTLDQVPFEDRWQPDPAMPRGETRELAPGRPGSVQLTLRRVYADDLEVASMVLEEQVLEKPVERVLAFGTRPFPAEAQPAQERVREIIQMLATAYDPGPRSTGKRPGDPGYGVTASGMLAGYGVVAVDPRVIPLGTRLFIPEYGFAVAGDTGGAIVGNRIDLGFASEPEALHFGIRTVDVYVLD
jgi:3D (Asp-Asp-Asp) domain-containing protein